jgi:hypothetical protein
MKKKIGKLTKEGGEIVSLCPKFRPFVGDSEA